MLRFQIRYFDPSGNQVERDFSAFCALECNGQILDYFPSEDSCIEALAAVQHELKSEVSHDVR